MVVFTNSVYRACFLVILCVVFYGNTLGSDYAYDDSVVITQNRFTQQGLAGIPGIFAHNTFQGSYDGQPTIERYRPLSVATFAVEHEFFGDNPHLSHAGNIAIFAWAVLILFALLRTLFGDRDGKEGALGMPFVAAMLFIVHPVHTEIVANIKGRDDLLALAGALTALYLLLRYVESGRRRHWVWAGFFFLVALFSKENALTFLAIAPLALFYQGKADRASYLRAMAPLAIAVALFLVARGLALRGGVPASSTDILADPFAFASTPARIATAFSAFVHYLRLLVAPYPLTIDYHLFHAQVASFKTLHTWVGLGLSSALVAYAFATLKRRSVAAFGILFFLVSFSIVSNLFFSVGAILSERFLFIPSVGAIAVAAWAFSDVLPLANRYKGGVLVAVMLACGWMTVDRNRAWKDDFTLFTTDAKTSRDSIKANLAASVSYLEEAGKIGDGATASDYRAKAVEHAARAVSLVEQRLPEAQRGPALYAHSVALLGDAYAADGKTEPALQTYRSIYATSTEKERLAGMVEQILEKSPDVDFRIRNYLEFVRLDPDNFQFNYRLGYAYGKDKNDLVMSVHHLSKAVAARPNEVAALEAVSHAHKLMRNFGQAAAYLEKAAALKPGDSSYAKRLVSLYAQAGDEAKAAEWMGRLGAEQ